MKFLFVAPRFHTNQAPIVKTLLKYGHEVRFFVQYVGGIEDHTDLTPRVFHCSRFSRFLLFFLSTLGFKKSNSDPFKMVRRYGIPPILKYYRAIKDYRPDIVIVRDRTIFSLLTFIICNILGINSILYQQIPKYSETMEKTSPIKRLVYGMIVPQIRITPINGKSIKAKYTSKSTYYLPFIMVTNEGEEDKSFFRGSKINILAIGKFVPRKRHIFLVKVVEELKAKYDLKLTIVGEVTTRTHEQEYEKVLQYIKDRNLTDCVTLKTNLEHPKIKKEYRNNDLFILPSVNEPLGVSVLEAMSHKLPVICSDTDGAKDYICEGINGYVFESDNSTDLIKKISNIISDKNKLIAMGEKSLELVKTKYSPEQYHKSLMEIIKKEFPDITL